MIHNGKRMKSKGQLREELSKKAMWGNSVPVKCSAEDLNFELYSEVKEV